MMTSLTKLDIKTMIVGGIQDVVEAALVVDVGED
jgi:hypothetical protein